MVICTIGVKSVTKIHSELTGVSATIVGVKITSCSSSRPEQDLLRLLG